MPLSAATLMRPCGLWLSTIPRKDNCVLKTCILIWRALRGWWVQEKAASQRVHPGPHGARCSLGKRLRNAESLSPAPNTWGWDEQAKTGFLGCFLSWLSSLRGGKPQNYLMTKQKVAWLSGHCSGGEGVIGLVEGTIVGGESPTPQFHRGLA